MTEQATRREIIRRNADSILRYDWQRAADAGPSSPTHCVISQGFLEVLKDIENAVEINLLYGAAVEVVADEPGILVRFEYRIPVT